MGERSSAGTPPGSAAFRFVLLMGVVDLFGDTTYSGGASMNGLFLASVGAGAVVISVVGGLSEFLNYLTRGVSGYFGDRIRRRWALVFVGYGINLLAVPALAFAGHWPLAAGLIVLQGIGRGIRKPLVQAMLSYTTKRYGKGRVYGVNTALDHTGRTLGPLLVAGVLALAGTFRTGYALLVIPAVLALLTLTVARIRFPAPAALEQRQPSAPASAEDQHPAEESRPVVGPQAAGERKSNTSRAAATARFSRAYWLYLAAGACFAAGLMNFELISFHLARSGVTRDEVPLFLALATGVGALASLGLGRLYDRIGLTTVLLAVVATAAFSPFVFLLPVPLALVGMALWGVGQATQDTLLTALVAGVLPPGRRNLAFGLYYAGYGVGWLVGAVAAGLLYERSHVALVAFAAALQLAALPIFLAARRRAAPPRRTRSR